MLHLKTLIRRLVTASIFTLAIACFATGVFAEDKSRSISLADLNFEQIQGHSDHPLATPVSLPFSKKLPGKITDYVVIKTEGHWSHEYILRAEEIKKDGVKISQHRGRGSVNIKPWIILFNKNTHRGICVMVAYMGNWVVEVLPQGKGVVLKVRTSPASMTPIDTLGGGLPVPGALVSEFEGHWDYGTLPIRRYIREHLRRDLGPEWPVVQFNDYFANFGNMNEAILLKAVPIAASLGCELFTIDAGWYGANPDWSKSVGDWGVNTNKFPRGLGPIRDEVRRLGMKFGMWVEIESVWFDGPVRTAHPEWDLPNSPVIDGRVVLNFGRPDVLEWAKKVLDVMIQSNKLDYIKMDFNTDCSYGSEKYKGDEDPLVQHNCGLLKLMRYLRTAYPSLIVENCSGGSGRHEAVYSALTDTHWVSDNVANHQNLTQNYGATAFFPPEICNHWTTEPEDAKHSEVNDLEARFRVNMVGHFGISGKIWDWKKETLETVTREIALYKQLRPLICKADVYHLTAQADFENPATAQVIQHLDPGSGRAVIFAYQNNDPQLKVRVRLRELNPSLNYLIKALTPNGPADVTIGGQQLIQDGLEISFPHKGASIILSVSSDGSKSVVAVPPSNPPGANLVWVPSGSFNMGATMVCLSKGFWMGKYEVTQGEYQEIFGTNHCGFAGNPKRPMENVMWSEAVEYCQKLTGRERAAGRISKDWSYRLPTEAEWEYACRAGTTTQFSYGDDANYKELSKYAWFGDMGGMTHEVGLKKPNPWGLYDMMGNVWEWCSDFYGPLPKGNVFTDPKGPAAGYKHILRGGGWSENGSYCQSSERNSNYPYFWSHDYGFRVVLAPN